MRKFAAFGFLLLCASSAIAASRPVAKLHLPCDSYYQVLSPNGTQLAWPCKDGSLRVLSVPNGKELRVIPAEPRVNSVAFSPDSQWMAVGFRDGTVEVAPSNGSIPRKRWNASARRIDILYFFPDSKTLVVGPADDAGQVWELAETPKLQATIGFEFGGMSACVRSPDGKLLIVAGDDTVLRWYETATWKKTLENRDFLLETFALAFTPDGKQVLAGGADSRITVLDAATAKSVRQLPPETGSYVVMLDILGDQRSAATVYLDDTGEKPPYALVRDLATGSSVAFRSDSPTTCGSVIAGRFWLCTADGKTLSISEYE
jgi:WD40 repeat protein